MGEDLLTAKFEKGALQKKYKNYFAPAARISVGTGKKDLVKSTGVQLQNIQVSLNIDSAASVSFTVTNFYNPGEQGIKQSVKSLLVCGAAIKVELGYGSEYVDVFYGFIYEIAADYSEMPSMQVTAMDVKRLMADNLRLGYVWKNKTISEIFSEIMRNYSGLSLTASVCDNGSDVIEQMIQRGSDLHLIKKLCQAKGLKFMVYGNQAKLLAKSETAAVVSLSWGSDLISFTQSSSYVNVHVEVRGSVKGSPETGVVCKSQDVESPGAKKCGLNPTIRVIEETNIESAEDVDDRLNDEVEELKEHLYSCQGSCMGMPVLIPGRYIGIEGIDDAVNGDYYLKSVSHSFGTDGFTTNFTLGGKR